MMQNGIGTERFKKSEFFLSQASLYDFMRLQCLFEAFLIIFYILFQTRFP
jgi:hypothetical protein